MPKKCKKNLANSVCFFTFFRHFSPDSIDRNHNVVVYKASDVDHEKASKMSCGLKSTVVRRLQVS